MMDEEEKQSTPIIPTRVIKLIEEALAIQAEEAKDAGAIGYMARVLTQCTMPHSQQSGNEFTRTNGLFSMSIIAPGSVGLPYGSYPRLLLAWTTTEAVRTKNHVLELGPSLSGFMGELGLIPTGGRWGTIPSIRKQMKSLYSSSVSCMYEDNTRDSGIGLRIAKEIDLWWSPKDPDQTSLWTSTVTLSKDFFDEITDKPIPIDIRALKALKRSPLALDIYCWLTYRMSYLAKSTVIPWEALQMQFGAGYPLTSQGKADFKRKFENHLRSVLTIYSANVEKAKNGLLFKPSKPHIPKLVS